MNRLVRLLPILVLCLAVASCAAKEKKLDSKENFLKKWRIMADESKGHSPAARKRSVNIADSIVRTEDVLKEIAAPAQKPLPTERISLRMHDANISAVLQAMARAVDQSIILSPDIEGTVTINIVKRPWGEVFEGVLRTNGLTFEWQGETIRVMTLEAMQQAVELDTLITKRKTEKSLQAHVEPLYSSVIPVHFADAANLKSELATMLTRDADEKTRGSIEVDTHSNSLVVQAIRGDIERIVKLVNKLDHPSPQVQIKAHIVTTSRNFAHQLGFKWGGTYRMKTSGSSDSFYAMPGSTTSEYDRDDNTLTYTPNLGDGGSGQGLGVNTIAKDVTQGAALGLMYGNLAGSILEFQLQAFENDELIKILSSPTITTMDNQKAYTESGEEIPYESTSSDEGNTVEFKDAVTRLEITPHVIGDELLKMQILITKDERTGSVTGANNYPILSKKKTETTVVVRNGETIVISGLSDVNNKDSDTKVPYLADVPGLGYLFKGKDLSDEVEETLYFITPTILDQWKEGESQRTIEEIEQELAQQHNATTDGQE